MPNLTPTLRNKFLLIVILSFAVFVFFLLDQMAMDSRWQNDLQIDVAAFRRTAQYFTLHQSFSGLSTEYLPAALYFFLVPLPLGGQSEFTVYLAVFITLNLGILALTTLMLLKIRGYGPTALFLTGTLVLGPVLLFRFDLLAALLTLTAVISFSQKRYSTSAFLLGLGTAVKLYPALLLPYFFLILVRQRSVKSLTGLVTLFVTGFALPLLIYPLAGGDPAGVINSIRFHTDKPVSFESITGTTLTLKALATTGHPPAIVLENGVWGLTDSTNWPIVNFLPYALIGLLYLYLTLRRTRRFNPAVAFLILITLVVFDKNPNPQYLYWLFSLFPLVVWSDKRRLVVIYLLMLAIFATTQLVYPLHYGDLLYRFFSNGTQSQWFYVLVLRNGFMIALFGTAATSILRKTAIKNKDN